MDTLIRAHSLILWFVSLLGACLYGSAGEQMGLLSHFCEIYFACGDVPIKALKLILWFVGSGVSLTEDVIYIYEREFHLGF